VLQLLRIERPPLVAANTPSIHQRGVTAAAGSSEPLVGGAKADARLGGQGQEGFAVINLSAQQPFPTEGCQAGHFGGYAWGTRSVDRPVTPGP